MHVVSQSAANSNPLMYAYDYNSNLKFLIDTGASISVIPSKRFNTSKDKPDGGSLRAANGSSINIYGEKLLNFDYRFET